MKLSLKQLQESVRYNPKTGLFTRKWKTMSAIKPIGNKKTHGYIVFQVNGHRDYAHRFAWFYMTKRWPKELDHINGDRSDNRWCNLRESTRTQNNGNRKIGYKHKYHHLPKGVILVKNKNSTITYWARITFNGKSRWISSHRTASDAHASYMIAAKKLFGNFARAR